MRLRALLFDVDGTLAETERDGHRPAFNRAFTEFSLDWHWDVALYGQLLKVTGGKERIKYYMQHYLNDESVDDDAVARLHKAKTLHYVEQVANGDVPLRPGVERLLHEAMEKGLRLAIATTTSMANVTALLKTHFGRNSLDWFEFIGAGDVVEGKKPAPDIYLLTLERMGLEPQECLAFEDSHNGLLAAKHAHLPTVISPSYYTTGEDFSLADLVIDHLGEPDRPFTVMAGNDFGQRMLNVSLLNALHGNVKERS